MHNEYKMKFAPLNFARHKPNVYKNKSCEHALNKNANVF